MKRLGLLILFAAIPVAAAAADAAPSEPPAWAGDYAADQIYGADAMAHPRHMARMEMGDMRFSKVMLNLAEGRSGGAYRWDASAWYGGDFDKVLLRTEGEGSRREGVGAAEAQVLWSHAVSPYVDLQAGLRQDFEPKGRTYAAVGAEGLLPYWIDVQGALFLSPRGDLHVRGEASYDLRLTQRWVLQPRMEVNATAHGRSDQDQAEAGLRLRYEIRREFAPYVGVSWERRFGDGAARARTLGEPVEDSSVVVGVRTWF